MKKLLAILGAVGLTATASSAVVACGNVQIDQTSNFDLTTGKVTATLTEGLKSTDEKAADLIPTDAEKDGKDVTSLFSLLEGYKSKQPVDFKAMFVPTDSSKIDKDSVASGATQTYTVKGTLTVSFTPNENLETYGETGQNSYFTYTLRGIKDGINKNVVEPITFHFSKTTIDFNKMSDDKKTIVLDQDMITQTVATKDETVDGVKYSKGDKEHVNVISKLDSTSFKIQKKDSDGTYKDLTNPITKAEVADFGKGKKALDDELQVTLTDALASGDYQIVVTDNAIIADATITFTVK